MLDAITKSSPYLTFIKACNFLFEAGYNGYQYIAKKLRRSQSPIKRRNSDDPLDVIGAPVTLDMHSPICNFHVVTLTGESHDPLRNQSLSAFSAIRFSTSNPSIINNSSNDSDISILEPQPGLKVPRPKPLSKSLVPS